MGGSSTLSHTKPYELAQDYRNLLAKIFGETVVDSLVDFSRNGVSIKLKEPEKLNQFIKNYEKRSKNEGCKTCKNVFLTHEKAAKLKDFSKRKMDFPSWLDSIDFRNQHRKQIMLIGEDVSPDIKRYIGIAYALGRYPIKSNGEVKSRTEKKNKLWFRLHDIFGNLEPIKKNLYITDTSKCHAYKISQIWKNCSESYLHEEIELINPEIIIFQGRTAFDKTSSILKKMSAKVLEDPSTSSYFTGTNFPKFGKICFPNGKEITYLKIYHSSTQNAGKHCAHKDGYKKLIEDKIQPLIDHTHA